MKTVVKIALGIILAVIIMLVGCTALIGSSDTSTTSSTSEKTEKQESTQPLAVENNDFIKVEILNAEYDSIFGETINLKVKNKTEQNIAFKVDKVKINDEATAEVFAYIEISPNTTNKDNMLINAEDFEDYVNGEVEITIPYEIVNSDNYETIDSGEIKVNI